VDQSSSSSFTAVQYSSFSSASASTSANQSMNDDPPLDHDPEIEESDSGGFQDRHECMKKLNKYANALFKFFSEGRTPLFYKKWIET